MQVFDGKFHSVLLEEQIVSYLNENGVPEGVLLIVQIGSDPSSAKYISLKLKLCEKLGIKTRYCVLSEESTDDELYRSVKNQFEAPDVIGGIIQLPLPRQSLYPLLDLIPYEKDIDLLSVESLKRFYSDDFSYLSPVVRSLQYFIDVNSIGISGEGGKDSAVGIKVGVLGHGMLVGKPLTHNLRSKGYEVAVIDDYQKGKQLNYQILVLSAGVPSLVFGEDIQPGCHVVDYGSSVVEGKVVGDLNSSSSLDHLGIVSLSPGGIGPLVVRFLIMNYLGL